MSLWLILTAMTALAVVLLVLPLLRGGPARAARRDYDLEVYRAQLREVERDRASGLLGEDEARAARLEVERRILAAAGDPGKTGAAAPGSTGTLRLVAGVVAILGLPLVSGGLYWLLGSPELPDMPFAARESAPRTAESGATPGRSLPPVGTLITRLEQHLSEAPEDLEGWLRLGRGYVLVGRYDDAVKAYRRALSLDDGLADVHAALGEALVMQMGGTVGEEAYAAFERALELDPADPRARFYEGLRLVERGELQPALDSWLALLRDTPADAPWLDDLRGRVTDLAEQLDLDPREVLPPAPAGAAVAGARPDRDQVERLAARLEAAPKDWQGWIELARSWAALDEPERARDALARGGEAYQGAPFVRQQLQRAAAELGLDGGPADGAPRGPSAEQMRAAKDMAPDEQDRMIRDMVGGLAARLEQNPDDPEGWRMLGRSWRVLGERQKSAEAFKQLASRWPDDAAAQLDYAQALLALGEQGQPLSAEVVAQMSRVLELDPTNQDALFYLGRAAAERGDTAAARASWQRLLAELPPASPERARVQTLIDGLAPGG